MNKPVTWSYSALNAYETCPHRYNLCRVTKKVVEPQNSASIEGNRTHKSMEMAALGKVALPKHLKKYQKYIDGIFRYEGKRVVEVRMAVDKNFRPCTWMAKEVWCRGIVDIGVIGSKTAIVMDWKTGKRKPDSDQLKLFAAMVFAHYPWVEKVLTGFIWMKFGTIDQATFYKKDVPDIWNEFIPRVGRIERSMAQDKWLAKPSGLCREWCPVGRNLCEFCGV